MERLTYKDHEVVIDVRENTIYTPADSGALLMNIKQSGESTFSTKRFTWKEE